MQILISLSEQSHCLPQVTSTTNNVLGVKEYKVHRLLQMFPSTTCSASNTCFSRQCWCCYKFSNPTPPITLDQTLIFFGGMSSEELSFRKPPTSYNKGIQCSCTIIEYRNSTTKHYFNSPRSNCHLPQKENLIIPVIQSPPSPISKSSVKFSIPSSVTTTLDHKQSSTVLILHDQSVNRHDNRHDTRDVIHNCDISPTSELSSSFEKSVNLSFQKLEPADHAEYIVSKQQLRKVTSTMQEHAFAHAKSQNHLSNTSSPKPRQSALSEGREPSKRIMSATSTPARSKQLHNMQIVISLSEQSHRFPQMTSTTNNVLGVKEGSLSAQLHDLRRSKKLKQSESS
ncbi:hypothetical protein L5515_017335 [Caenorhabditis briggsae]|uniref:Uncharacterized protein n=1 Tax=Caenorhabditis briggsae TaxID=6238 RepID=A0AAE9FGA6_CAEBR|nr:hypothetical protein L5515_017335 [Caenorhabditis briggsae]